MATMNMYILKNIYGLFLIIIFGLLSACGDVTDSNTISIDFISASPTSITLKGTGGAGLSETSTVTFLVRDPNGVILTNQAVHFSLSTSVGGITLQPTVDISDSFGLVSTVIQSGSIPTSVRVIAFIDGTNISTSSDLLSITSGLPDQDSFSISSDLYNPEAWSVDGVESHITVRLGDVFNNPVPAGTSVSFTAEGGSIDGTCSTDSSGACTVTWRSQNPRPLDGRVSILATALGQESFVDINGNGLFDMGDTFTDLAEAYRDDDDSLTYTLGEFFVDTNLDGLYSAADGKYNGLACMPGYVLCSAQKHVHISNSVPQEMVLVMSSHTGIISTNPAGPINVSGQATVSIFVTIADINGNSMPGTSSIEVIPNNGIVDNQDFLPSIIPTNQNGPFYLTVQLTGDDTPSTGSLTIKVTSPEGYITYQPITVID